MLKITKKMEEITKRKTGLSPSELANLSETEELDLLVKKNNQVPIFSTKKDFRKLGRGNPLLANRRFRTMSYIDKRINDLCK